MTPKASCPNERSLRPNAVLIAETIQTTTRSEVSVYEMDETCVLQSWKSVKVTETHGRAPEAWSFFLQVRHFEGADA